MFEKNPDNSIDLTAGGAAALIDDYASAGEPQQDTPTPPKSDKRGYVKSTETLGDPGVRAEHLEASDVAFLAPELTSEAEGPLRAPERADGRLGYRFVKRAFDIAFSLAAIAVLIVPSIALCIAIRVESPGFPIYSQKRVGRIGRGGEVRTFDMYKFRSMSADADERLADLAELNEADGPLFKIKDDPRVDSRIIETNAKKPLSALAFASVFPPKTTGLPAAFPQVDVRISSLRNLLENSSRIFLANADENPSLSKKLAICPFAQIAGSGRLGSSCVATALQAV